MNWISVKDKLPDVFYPDLLLVVVKGPNYSYVKTAGYFDDFDDEYMGKAHFELEDVGYIDLPAEVTYWMPLPSLPEEAEQ